MDKLGNLSGMFSAETVAPMLVQGMPNHARTLARLRYYQQLSLIAAQLANNATLALAINLAAKQDVIPAHMAELDRLEEFMYGTISRLRALPPSGQLTLDHLRAVFVPVQSPAQAEGQKCG